MFFFFLLLFLLAPILLDNETQAEYNSLQEDTKKIIHLYIYILSIHFSKQTS